MELSPATIEFVKKMNGLTNDEDVIRMWKAGVNAMEKTKATSLCVITDSVKSAMREEMRNIKKKDKTKKERKERRVKKI